MLDTLKRKHIISLIKREVVPAVGCTEPSAVALCAAYAARQLPDNLVPELAVVRASANILKNSMGVGIPGTGMIGLPIAVALGSLYGNPDDLLEVLGCVNHNTLAAAQDFIDRNCVKISLADDAPSILHIDVTVRSGIHTARAVISGSHTNLILLELDGKTLVDKGVAADGDSGCDADPQLDMATVWEFATTTPVEELTFILESRRYNMSAAKYALGGNFGHALGSTVLANGRQYWGDSVLCHMIGYTSAACDARMGGAPVAVMSNSGSGNQGITATLPVAVFAADNNADEVATCRALTLSHLTSIYIKQSLGRLSALCGCVVASTGASVGIVYLMGGGFTHACAAIKNMIANLTGMICDGAKPSCSMKISSGVSTAFMSALMALNGKCVSSAEGIVCDDVDVTIHNLTSIGREAMSETDRLVLEIMTNKKC